jgi:hypothetical protein
VFDEARQLAISRLDTKKSADVNAAAKRKKYEQLLLADAAWTRSCILMGHVGMVVCCVVVRVNNSFILSILIGIA